MLSPTSTPVIQSLSLTWGTSAMPKARPELLIIEGGRETTSSSPKAGEGNSLSSGDIFLEGLEEIKKNKPKLLQNGVDIIKI